jgi:Sec7 domain
LQISPVLPPELEAASQDQEKRQDRSSPEMVVILPDDEVMDLPPEGHVHTNGLKLKSQAFVHPESARACMEMFPLQGMKLDEALRLFLTDVKLVGETEARQRVIDLFAMRYVECNPKSYYTRGKRLEATSKTCRLFNTTVKTKQILLNSVRHAMNMKIFYAFRLSNIFF